MIRIEEIEVEEFRGIRKLTLVLGGKNFGISGPNGTGKSGVVDAIEFAITGSVTRLEGRGTSDISVKAHAPHVDSRAKTKNSKVRLVAFIPSLNKKVTIERSVDAPLAPTITPSDPKVKAVIADLAIHPEFALSRREIIKYVLTPPGQRAKDVQDLLRLEQIEKLRQSLQKVGNEAKNKAKQAHVDDERTRKEFLQALGIASFSKKEMLAAVNERRSLLQLAPITDISPGISLKEGIVTGPQKIPAKPKIPKALATKELAAFADEIMLGETPQLKKNRTEALAVLQTLRDNPETLRAFSRQVLIRQGLELLDEDACPLCDTAWDMHTLRAHLEEKLTQAKTAADLFTKLGDAAAPITDKLEGLGRQLEHLAQYCGLAEPKIDTSQLQTTIAAWAKNCQTIDNVVSDPSLLDDAISALSAHQWKVSDGAALALSSLKTAIDGLPDPSKEDAAREYLAVAQDRYDRCRTAKSAADTAVKQEATAVAVLKHYEQASTAVLEGVYKAVESDFTACYRAINHEDENEFEGRLKPSFGKLAFDVDFYGRGLFPPGAYHSEGHQDGMGLCLYLALMKHTLGKDFTFAVLDDVLMSVDAGHRREVCKMLKEQFPKTQFILTTHDPVWLAFMRTENLIQSSVSFAGWSVDTGPKVWKDGDVWAQITERLEANDVPGAAATLRRYLEYTATILADNFRAAVDFHANGQYDLGDLLPPVLEAYKSALAKAKAAAISWGNSAAAIEALQKNFKEKVAKSQVEQWMINKAVHYVEWANLQKDEFAVVAAAFKELLGTMRCTDTCGVFSYVLPKKGTREALRCDCGAINFNLKEK